MGTILFAFSLLTVIGCQTIPGPTAKPIHALVDSSPAGEDYRLGPGDEIAIKFVYNPSMNVEMTIGPDGKIHPYLVGGVTAAGLTLDQLKAQLSESYYKVLGYSTAGYTLGVGDIIEARFLFSNELNTTMPIRPDGNISLPLIGEVKAAGRAPAELTVQLNKKYAGVLEPPSDHAMMLIVRESRIPELTITLKSSASYKIYVGGEVGKPGVLPITGTVRSLDALISAGGAKKSAKLETAVLVRNDGSQKPQAYVLNLYEVISGERSDVTMKPYDILYLPKTKIEQADEFMQHIYHIVPFSVLVNFPFNFGPSQELTVQNPQ